MPGRATTRGPAGLLQTFLHAVATLVVLSLAGCMHVTSPLQAPSQPAASTATQVLRGIATVTGARELVATAVAVTGLPVGWLTSDTACVVATAVHDTSEASIAGIEAAAVDPGMPQHRWHLSDCGLALGPVAVPPGSYLVADNTIGLVEGALLLGGVYERDPVGFGVGCGSMEWARVSLPATLGTLETVGLGGRDIVWPAQSFDAAACYERLVARDRKLRDDALAAGVDLAAFDGAVFEVTLQLASAR